MATGRKESPGAANQPKTQGVGFGAQGAFALFEDVTWQSFLASCVAGNDHYMAEMPPELVTPHAGTGAGAPHSRARSAAPSA